MRRTLLFLILGVASALASAAQAQTRYNNWVASYGTDSGTCGDRSTPCATFGQVVANVGGGDGTISCVDAGNFGAAGSVGDSRLMIGVLTIDCESVVGAAADGFLVTGGNVTVRGLALGSVGFFGQGILTLEKVRITNGGVVFTPTGTTNIPAELHITDCDIVNSTVAGPSLPVAAGVLVNPQNGMPTLVHIERSRINRNSFGVFIDATAAGYVNGTISDSYVEGNINNGISVNTNGATVQLMVDNTKLAGNNYGLAVGGKNGLMLVQRSTITANNNGLSVGGGGQMVSYGNNAVNNNGVDGAFSFVIRTQ